MEQITQGVELVVEGIKVLARRPILALPLLVCWLLFAPSLLYLHFFCPVERLSPQAAFAIALGFLLLWSGTWSFSCLVLLELLQPLKDRRVGLAGAIGNVVRRDVFKALPIIFAWAVVWLLLIVIDCVLFPYRREHESEDEFSVENAASVLSGNDGSARLSDIFFALLQKGVRMAVFLILPAVVWERKGPLAASKCGLEALRAHFGEFLANLGISALAAFVVFVPPSVLFAVKRGLELNVPSSVWIGVIVYCAFAWSFSLYIEQMFAAELYLWHMKWRRSCDLSRANGLPLPRLYDVSRPSLLERVPKVRKRAARHDQGARPGT